MAVVFFLNPIKSVKRANDVVDDFITKILIVIVKLFYALKFIAIFSFPSTIFKVIKIIKFIFDAFRWVIDVFFHNFFVFLPIHVFFTDFSTFLSNVRALGLIATAFYALTSNALLALKLTNFILFYVRFNQYLLEFFSV